MVQRVQLADVGLVARTTGCRQENSAYKIIITNMERPSSTSQMLYFPRQPAQCCFIQWFFFSTLVQVGLQRGTKENERALLFRYLGYHCISSRKKIALVFYHYLCGALYIGGQRMRTPCMLERHLHMQCQTPRSNLWPRAQDEY